MYKFLSALAVMVSLSAASFSASSAVLRDTSDESRTAGASQQTLPANSAPQAASQPFSGGEIVSGEWSGGSSGSSSFGSSNNGSVGSGIGRGSASPFSSNGGFSLADLLVYFDGVPYIALPDLRQVLEFLLATLNNGGSLDAFNPGTSGNGSAPVPLPGPILLFGSALLGLFGYQRATKK